MASFAAQMLDELMGRDRDRNPTDKRREIHWEDPEVCKYLLCGFCPHELFTNTRADLGPCDKLHDPDFKKSYEKSARYERMGYEEDFLRFLQGLLTDVERRIRRGQQRLALNNAQNTMATTPQAAREEKVQMLTERINELVEQAEQLGCEGKVEEAQGVMKLCDQLREERSQLEAMDEKSQQQGASGAKDMEVCEVCGALLVVGDAQQRLDEHIMGKQHMGYARIRSYIDSKKTVPKPPRAPEEGWDVRAVKEREDREKEREKEREERKRRNEEREKEREKERETRRRKSRSKERGSKKHGRRSRSRDRDKDSRRRRSRSKDKRRSRSRHRSRDRNRRSSRERRRSRSNHRRSRSRSRRKSSREKDRKSRDKERSSKDRHDSSRDREDPEPEQAEKKTEEHVAEQTEKSEQPAEVSKPEESGGNFDPEEEGQRNGHPDVPEVSEDVPEESPAVLPQPEEANDNQGDSN